MKKLALIAATILVTSSAFASDVICQVGLNGRKAASGTFKMNAVHNDETNDGNVLLAKQGNIKVYALNNPLIIVAQLENGGVVVKAKTSSQITSALMGGDVAQINTMLGDTEVQAHCQRSLN